MFSNNLLMAAAGGGGADYVIEGSGFFADNAYHTYNIGTDADSLRTMEFEWWRKDPLVGGSNSTFFAGDGTENNRFNIGDIGSNNMLVRQISGGSTTMSVTVTNAKYRDAAAWDHWKVRIDTTQAVEANRVIVWHNDVLQTVTFTTAPAQNLDLLWGDVTYAHHINRHFSSAYEASEYYYAGIAYYDGVTSGTSQYAETSNDGYAQVIDTTDATFGANGFLLKGGVDVAAGNDSSAPGAGITNNIVPAMTSATVPSGDVDKSSELNAGNAAWKVFDHIVTAGWQSSGVGTQWLEYHFDTTKTVTTYSIIGTSSGFDGDPTRAPKDWTFEASNTGAWGGEEVTLDTVTGETGWTSGVPRKFSFANTTAYSYYRLVMTDNNGNGSYYCVIELTLHEAGDGQNHFTPSGTITATNDSPTNGGDSLEYGNYPTWSPINGAFTEMSLEDGNLRINGNAQTVYQNVMCTQILPLTGSWGIQMTVDVTNKSNYIGICRTAEFEQYLAHAAAPTSKPDTIVFQCNAGGTIYNDGSSSQSNVGVADATDTVEVVVDMDNDEVQYYLNGVAHGTAESFPANPNGEAWILFCGAGGTDQFIVDFGQLGYDPSSEDATALTLNSANFPTPAIPDPTEHHQVELVAHDGSSTAFTCNWDADTYDTLFIIKNRDSVEAFHWIDGVRGYNKYFTSETTDAWTTDSNVITVSGTTITLGSTLANDNYVVECHRAGASASRTAHTADVPPDLASTTSFNSVTGFCIMTWTGGGTLGQTINHGMGQAPDLFISSQDNASQNKRVYHSSIGATKYINLESTNGTATSSNFMNDTEPTASVISLGATGFSNNDSGASHVGYAWYSVEGNSAFGSYEGNASTDGIVVNVGIKPLSAFVKAIDSTDWWQKMETVGGVAFNGDCDALYYNSTYAETDEDANNGIDIISNGLKMRGAGGQINAAETYIYGIWGGTPIQGPAPASNTSQGRAR